MEVAVIATILVLTVSITTFTMCKRKKRDHVTSDSRQLGTGTQSEAKTEHEKSSSSNLDTARPEGADKQVEIEEQLHRQQTDHLPILLPKQLNFEKSLGKGGQGRVMITQDPTQIITGMLSALEYMHISKVHHRDLKPDNVGIGRDGRVKLLDYGCARVEHPGNELRNVGTWIYQAPEESLKICQNHAGDLWAFGCVLIELYSGSHPFIVDNIGSYWRQMFAKIGSPDEMFLQRIPETAGNLQQCVRTQMNEFDNRTWKEI